MGRGLSPNQKRVLDRLGDGEVLMVDLLTDRTNVARASLSRTLRRLKRRGLIETMFDSSGRGRVQYTLVEREIEPKVA
jgi:DNA-binding MarR family transcriptional regulator